jgi:monofunctional biosynthetic peptidoglycan transglycosylase
MVIRAIGGASVNKDWRPLERISPNLARAVLAAEDTRFCEHLGLDLDALQRAWRRNQEGGRTYGGSTITMQTAKNAFLWPGRDYVRKAFEAYFALLEEGLWGKRRTLEVYLNIIEWDDGVYGAEAAARRHFGKSASALTAREAAALAAVLPNPRAWSPSRPTRYIQRRTQLILRRMEIVNRDGLDRCVIT